MGKYKFDDLILFKDYIEIYKEIESETWISIFENKKNEENDIRNDTFGISVMIDQDFDFYEYLKDYEWGFDMGSFGKSTFYESYTSGSEKIEFHDGIKKDAFEYLVAYRSFNSKYDSQVEINPKLIWYGNLVKVHANYIDPITDETIIKVTDEEILVKRRYLKDFSKAFDVICAVVFDHRRYFKTNAKIDKYYDNFSDEKLFINLCKIESRYGQYNGYSSIIGKVIIKPYSEIQHRDYQYLTEEEKFEEFIIGENNDDGSSIMFTCNEKKLANYFGANPSAPRFLTEVHFRNKVLDLYRNDPRNYRVEDGMIFYLDEWSIPFTINEEDTVIVWLGDLGRIPNQAQMHWKKYNIKPEGKMEDKFFKRQMMSQFTDSILPEKKLFEMIAKINEYFESIYNAKIFNDLTTDDIEIKTSFGIPTNYSTTQYQTFLLNLSKIVVESINTKLISSNIDKGLLKDEKGNKFGSRMQLNVYLNSLELKSADKLDKVLRIIYNSRNKLSGHKASVIDYNKVWGRTPDYKPDFILDAKNILFQLLNVLEELAEELN